MMRNLRFQIGFYSLKTLSILPVYFSVCLQLKPLKIPSSPFPTKSSETVKYFVSINLNLLLRELGECVFDFQLAECK